MSTGVGAVKAGQLFNAAQQASLQIGSKALVALEEATTRRLDLDSDLALLATRRRRAGDRLDHLGDESGALITHV
jgi:hypothetical protein